MRNALDHVLRAISAEITPEEFEVNYSEKSLDKAYSHLYRAAYDALDWLSITLREQIFESLKPFSPRTIGKAIPDYYPTIRPTIDKINQKISEIRNSKDIATAESNLEAFNEYLKNIKTLKDYYQTITNAQASLVEIEGDSKGVSRRFWIGTGLIALATIIITYLLTEYF